MTKLIKFSDSFRWKRHVLTVLCGLLLLTILLSSAALGKEKNAMAMRLGGCGGGYFYASAGELLVEVEKQDLNIRRNKTHLRALLLGPDRSVVDQAWISDDGKATGSDPGPIQRVLLRTNVERPGVY